MSSLLIERLQVVEAAPAKLLDAGAITGDYVSLENYNRVAVVFAGGIGTAGDDPTLSIFQAQDVAGTGAKDLNPIAGKTWKKQAATSLAAVGQWSSAAADITANDVTNATAAEQALLWWVEFEAADLDVANGFKTIRADVDDPGTNAQPGYLFYILGDPRFPADADSMESAIA